MARISEAQVIEKAIKELKLDRIVDKIPKETSDKIVLGYDLNKKIVNFVKSAAKTSSGSQTIFTTSAVKETYLTGISFSRIKDAACDESNGYTKFQIPIGGEIVDILRFATLTLTAQQQDIAIEFKHPILIDKNSGVSLGTTSYAAGNQVRTGTVWGYEIDP